MEEKLIKFIQENNLYINDIDMAISEVMKILMREQTKAGKKNYCVNYTDIISNMDKIKKHCLKKDLKVSDYLRGLLRVGLREHKIEVYKYNKKVIGDYKVRQIIKLDIDLYNRLIAVKQELGFKSLESLVYSIIKQNSNTL